MKQYIRVEELLEIRKEIADEAFANAKPDGELDITEAMNAAKLILLDELIKRAQTNE